MQNIHFFLAQTANNQLTRTRNMTHYILVTNLLFCETIKGLEKHRDLRKARAILD